MASTIWWIRLAPILKHVTNPLTNERSYRGKDMPLVTWDVLSGADYIDITCQPKALGSGRWAALEIFTSPSLEQIEAFVMDCVLKAGSQHCPPVIMGVGIGGSFDYCTKLAKMATLRPLGSVNPEPILAAMEARLTEATNKTGFGPMGTGAIPPPSACTLNTLPGTASRPSRSASTAGSTAAPAPVSTTTGASSGWSRADVRRDPPPAPAAACRGDPFAACGRDGAAERRHHPHRRPADA
ncbi:fumarate hydratase [Pseudoroseomonas wenyumeiae]